jgi:hypothetical protein
VSEDGPGIRVGGCHELLLRLAGRLPDDLLTRCRDLLAAGAADEVPRAMTFGVLAQHVPLASPEVAALAELLAAAGDDASALGMAEIDDSDPMPWRFASRGPGDAELNRVMAAALAQEQGTVGCWRAWRVPGGDDRPPSPARRVFLVEVGPGSDLAAVTGRLQRWLAEAGEASPQVEVYHPGIDLPSYHRLIRGSGELIWAAAEDPGLRVATIFDEVDPQDGPRFSSGHPQLSTDEASKVARYLRGGEPVLVTTAQMDDVVDGKRQACVSLNFRTDGVWIWTEAAAYYADRHRLEPDPALLAHIRSNRHVVPTVDGVAVHRALALLMEPPDEEPAWIFGEPPDQEPGPPALGKAEA